MNEEKTIKGIIENYAHDFRNMPMSEEELTKVLWDFWREQEEVSCKEHLSQFTSRIKSYGFSKWYFNK